MTKILKPLRSFESLKPILIALMLAALYTPMLPAQKSEYAQRDAQRERQSSAAAASAADASKSSSAVKSGQPAEGKTSTDEQADQGKSVPIAAQSTKPRSGRLPRYFAAIVSPQQRTKIYEIQAEYRTQLAKIEAQLQQLRDTEMTEIESVLSGAQLKQLEQMRAAAEKMRISRLEMRTSGSRPSANATGS